MITLNIIITSVFQPMRSQNTAVEPAKISTARNNRLVVGWHENHERQVNLINKLQPCTIIICVSIVVGLERTSGKNISNFQKQ